MPSKSFLKIVIESIVVGILLIPITIIAGWLVTAIVNKPSLPEVCATWNKHNIMEINLFVAGFLFHMISEYSGLNNWYCKNYFK